jgi:hypothetical protein
MSQTISDAILYAQATHCADAHGNQLQILPSCATCLALHQAVQAATPHPFETVQSGLGVLRPPRLAVEVKGE